MWSTPSRASATASDSGFYDLSGNSNSHTSVSNIISANGNPTTTTFKLAGTGFSDSISVNLN